MPEFADVNGQKWSVDLDGLLLGELRDQAAIDIVQDGIFFIEDREDVLVKALLVLCRDQREQRQLTDKQFAKLIVRNAVDNAIEAVRGAAELFFRPNKWSEIQSRCEQRRALDGEYRKLQPLLETLNRPDMPQAMQRAVMAAITDQIGTIASQNSAPSPSASGQAATPPSAAGDLQGSSGSTQKE